jgi:N-acyl amino acid synthase of PEP-CTERM/exosortase system
MVVEMFDSRIAELQQTQALRYQVYCEERRFLPAEDYPDRVEIDEYDPHSIHFGSFDAAGELVGTVRIVQRNPLGFPMMRHCAIDVDACRVLDRIPRVAEISRLAISRDFHGEGDGLRGIETAGAIIDSRLRRSHRQSVVVSLYRAIYQASRRNEISHLLAAMEVTLRRLLGKFHFPFVQIGPPADYFGPVVPFVLDLDELDRVLAVKAPKLLAELQRGMEVPGKVELQAA